MATNLTEFVVATETLELEHRAEESLCGAVLRGGSEVFKQVRETVSADDFRVQPLRLLWQTFECLDEQQLKIDLYTVQDELERKGNLKEFQSGAWSGSVYLADIRGKGIPDSAVSYAENVKSYANKRRLAEIFKQGYLHATNGRRDKDIVMDTLEALSKIEVHGAQDEFTSPIAAALSEAFDWSTQAAAGNIPGVQTGFVDLDAMLTALMPGNVYIVAGRPGQGKTAFLVTIIRFLASKGFRVGVFSLEMSKMQVAQRLIAQEAGLNLKNVIDGNLTQNEWRIYADALARLERTGIVINDLSSINIGQIRHTSRRIKAKGGLDLIVVDYIQLAGSETKKRAERRELEVSEVSRGLKYLARELEVPVLAAAQLSRAVEQRADRRPVLSDLRESGSLEQDAYCVMFIHRNPDEPEPKQNITEIIIAKHRNGAIGSVELIFRPEVAKFENALKFRP